MRRAQIYAINERKRAAHEAEWHAYRQRRERQARALEACLAIRHDNRAREALRSLTRSTTAAAAQAASEAAAAAAAAEAHEAKLEEEARIWQMTLFEKAGLRPEDAELLNSMPLELTSRGPVRVCPRAQTNSGCTSPHCPLAHCRAPDSHITWKFRFWAFDAGHDGWLGEKVGPCAL